MPLLLFIVVPLIELLVLDVVATEVGWPVTLALLLSVSIGGFWLVKREGRRTWQQFQAALRDGRVPSTEIASGGLFIFGAALLLTPGFVTDALGLLLVIGNTRKRMQGPVIALLTMTVFRSSKIVTGLTAAQVMRKAARDRRGPADEPLEADVVHVERSDSAAERPSDAGH